MDQREGEARQQPDLAVAEHEVALQILDEDADQETVIIVQRRNQAQDQEHIARPRLGSAGFRRQAHAGRRLRQRCAHAAILARSEEHTSELQSLMSISYAVFHVKKKTTSQSK